MKNQRTIVVFIALIIIGAIGVGIAMNSGGVANNTKSASQPNGKLAAPKSPGANEVVISNYEFNPSPIKIKVGTTVTWLNKDIARHNVVTDEGQPAGGPKSELISKNGQYQTVFMKPGIYRYHCEPHPYMKGVIEVTL